MTTGTVLFISISYILLLFLIAYYAEKKSFAGHSIINNPYVYSLSLGVYCTAWTFFGSVGISIQLKAIGISYEILSTEEDFIGNWLDNSSFYRDKTLMITIILAVFTLLFGSVTYGIYNGFEDVFKLAYNKTELQELFHLESAGINSVSWTWLILLSMSAVLFLPRQFHVAVVENTNPNFVIKASWLFPLYLLLICLFVLPIAFAGLLHSASTLLIKVFCRQGNLCQGYC